MLTTSALRPGNHELQAADGPFGPYRTVGGFRKPGFEPLRLKLPGDQGYYRVLSMPE